MICATLNAWATEIGCDAQTLERRLVKAGMDWKRGDKLPAKIVLRAYYENPKDRLLLAQAEERERKNRVAIGELCEIESVLAFINERFVGPAIKAMDEAPSNVDSDWLENVLKPVIRVKLLPPKKEKK